MRHSPPACVATPQNFGERFPFAMGAAVHTLERVDQAFPSPNTRTLLKRLASLSCRLLTAPISKCHISARSGINARKSRVKDHVGVYRQEQLRSRWASGEMPSIQGDALPLRTVLQRNCSSTMMGTSDSMCASCSINLKSGDARHDQVYDQGVVVMGVGQNECRAAESATSTSRRCSRNPKRNR
jgi:hypothetical protein